VSVIDSINYTINQLEILDKTRKQLELSIKDIEKNIEKINQSLLDSKEEKTYYGKAIDIIYQESIGGLKDTINTALQYVFYDRSLEVELVLEDKRGTKTLDISLNDLDKDIFGLDIKEDEGQGIAAVISSVLKTFYLLNKGSYILLLDEKYSNVSREYVERFFTFLKQLAKEKHFIIVLVTHDDRFNDYASKVYQVSGGNVLLIKEEKEV